MTDIETPIIEAREVSAEEEQKLHRELPRKIKELDSRASSNSVRVLIQGVRLLYALLRDPDFKLALKSKALIIGAMLYFILPIDTIPDYIPFVGFVDDGLVVSSVLRMLVLEIDAYRQFLSRS